MEERNVEQQVWQRVRSCREETPNQDRRQMQRESMELASIYRNLATQLAGKPRELAQKLYLGEKANAEALAGIEILSRQQGEALQLWQPGKEPTRKVLEKCYHRSRRCMMEYTARSAENEFGIVFQKMAEREREHCVVIAELLGNLR